MDNGPGFPPEKIRHAAKIQNFLQWSFFIVQVLGGQVGMLFLLVTFLAKRKLLKSNVVVENFCFAWMLSSICYCLLLYTSRTDVSATDLLPISENLCLNQAILINGVQALTAVTTLALVVNLWISLVRPSLKSTPSRRLLVRLVLVGIPWFSFFTFLVAAYICATTPLVLKSSGDAVSNAALPTPLYCIVVLPGTFNDSPRGPFRLLVSAYIFSAVIHGFSVLLEVHIIYTIKKKSRLNSSFAAYKGAFYRILVLVVHKLLSIGLLAVLIETPVQILLEGLSSEYTIISGMAELVQAAIPLVAFFVLASRMDILVACGVVKRPTDVQVMEPYRSKANSQNSHGTMLNNNIEHYNSTGAIDLLDNKPLPIPPPVTLKKKVRSLFGWKEKLRST